MARLGVDQLIARTCKVSGPRGRLNARGPLNRDADYRDLCSTFGGGNGPKDPVELKEHASWLERRQLAWESKQQERKANEKARQERLREEERARWKEAEKGRNEAYERSKAAAQEAQAKKPEVATLDSSCEMERLKAFREDASQYWDKFFES